jgi:hypothetical protein
MTALDLATILPWLEMCGACDAGLGMNCTHPDGDYRTPMAALVTEVERLRAEATPAPAMSAAEMPIGSVIIDAEGVFVWVKRVMDDPGWQCTGDILWHYDSTLDVFLGAGHVAVLRVGDGIR